MRSVTCIIYSQGSRVLLNASKRNFSVVHVSKNIKLVTNAPIRFNKHNFLAQTESKPLVLLLSWLLAKQNHVNKFVNIYLDQGFDVLNVSLKPRQLLWPVKGAQIVANDVLQFLHVNKVYSPVFIHGFSVGAYVWAEVLLKLYKNPGRYVHIIERIVGQIWDSATEVEEITVGLPAALFPNSTLMQMILQKYVIFHLHIFKNSSTLQYRNASEVFHKSPVRSPSLFLVSKVDPVGTERANQIIRKDFADLGIKVYWKCWNDSPHVCHFYTYPKEYVKEMYTLMNELGLVRCPESMQRLM